MEATASALMAFEVGLMTEKANAGRRTGQSAQLQTNVVILATVLLLAAVYFLQRRITSGLRRIVAELKPGSQRVASWTGRLSTAAHSCRTSRTRTRLPSCKRPLPPSRYSRWPDAIWNMLNQ